MCPYYYDHRDIGTVVAIWRGGSDWTKWVERGNPDDVPD